MKRLTHLQKTRSKLVLGKAICFFPMNEGSGTTVTDIIGGGIITDAGATWADAHAFKAGNAGGPTAQSVIPDVADKHLLFVHAFKIFTSDSFAIFNLEGGSSRDYQLTGGSGFAVDDDSGGPVSATIGLGASSGDAFHAGSWNPVTGVINAYGGVNGGAVTLKNTNTANAARIAHDSGFGESVNIGLNTSAFDQGTYAAGVFAFDDEIPSDLLDALSHFSKEWRLGHKDGWAAWS